MDSERDATREDQDIALIVNDESVEVIESKAFPPVIELAVLISTIATNSLLITIQNFYLHQICISIVSSNNSKICDESSYDEATEKIIEEQATILATYRSIIELAPPLILAFYWGELNDKIGSKIPIIIPLVGFSIYSFGFSLLSNFNVYPVSILLLNSLAVGLTGGQLACSVSGYKYVASFTTKANRSFRIGIIETALQIGQPLGILLGTTIFQNYGFHIVFFVAFLLQCATLVIIIVFLKNNEPSRSEEKIVGENKCLAWIKSLHVIIKKRPNQVPILLLTGALCFRQFAVTESWTTCFLYTRLNFHWGQPEYSYFTTVDGLISGSGVLISSIIGLKLLKIYPETIGLIVSIFSVIGSCIWAFSTKAWMMYLGSGVQFSIAMTAIVARSGLSLLIPFNEIGKVFAFVGMLESLTQLLGGTFSNFVYDQTLNSFPGTIFLISASLYLLTSGFFTFLRIARKNY